MKSFNQETQSLERAKQDDMVEVAEDQPKIEKSLKQLVESTKKATATAAAQFGGLASVTAPQTYNKQALA